MRNSAETVPGIKSSTGRWVVHVMRHFGFPNHRIAAAFDENQGRVAEVLAVATELRPAEPRYVSTPWGLFEPSQGTFKAT